jgi:hypothetical protein
MSDCYLTLEEVKLNTSYLDGSIYKTYIHIRKPVMKFDIFMIKMTIYILLNCMK